MESPLPFSLLFIVFLILSLIQPSLAILGAKSYNLATNSLLTYQKFGFLPGGSITTSITLTQSPASGALVYLLICNSDAKRSITSLGKNNNVCQGQAISELMGLCMYKQVIFNDLDGVTRVLPFEDPAFIQVLVGLDNSMGPRPIRNTVLHDTSEPTILNMVKSNSSKQPSRLLTETIPSDSEDFGSDDNEDEDEDEEDDKDTDTDTDNPVTIRTDPAVSSTDNDGDDDTDEDNEQQEVLLRRILKAWIADEDFSQLENLGLDAETMDSLEDEKDDLSPFDLLDYLTNTINYQVVDQGMYFFLMLNCDNTASVTVDFALINPEQEHLSTGDIEYKALYCALIVSWTLIFGFWISTWVFNKFIKQKTYPLHYFFLITGFCCLVLAVIQEIYWFKYSDSGYSPISLRIFNAFLGGISTTLFLVLFLLIGKGYTYINLKLTIRDILDLVIFSVLRFVLSWMKEFFGKSVTIAICVTILYIFALFVIHNDFRKNQKKIKRLLASLQSPPQPTQLSNQTLSTRPSTVSIPIMTLAPGPQEGVIESPENINVLDQAYLDGVTPPYEEIPQAQHSLDEVSASQNRDIVMNFDKDIKMLAKKLQIVRWLKMLIIIDLVLICVGEIVCITAFPDKPFVLDLWYQFLFLTMFFVFTWFFNLKHKFAFIYSNINNVQDAMNQKKETKAATKTGPGYVDVADLYKIPGNFVVIENGVDSELRLASKMTKPPTVTLNLDQEKLKAKLKLKLQQKNQQRAAKPEVFQSQISRSES